MLKRILAILFLAAALSGSAQDLAPTDALGAAALFADEAECLASAKAAKDDAAGLFRAGRYLMAEVYAGQIKGGLEKRRGFELCRKSYGFFETAFRLAPSDALYAAWAGAARLLSCAYGNTFEAIQNGARGVDLFKTAIKLSPADPEPRLLRARAYVYLPRVYYPDCDDTILADARIAVGSPLMTGALLDEALCYQCIALAQLGKAEEAARALAKIDPSSRFAAMAANWRKR